MVTKRRRTRKGDPLLAVAYLRASTTEQLLGREAERVDVRRWAEANGVTILAEFVDQGVSGGNDVAGRPALERALLALTEQRAGVLLVKDRTRLARDVVVAATIDRTVASLGARVASADGVGNGLSPADGFVRTICDAASEMHRMTIKANTRAALAAKKRKGERVSRYAPYGFRFADDGKHVEPEPTEQATIAAARELRAKGLTLRAVAEELEVLGLMNRNGKAFGVAVVHAMIVRSAE